MKQTLKRCSYVLVTAVLILAFLSLFAYRNDNAVQTVKEWRAEDLIASAQTDCTLTQTEGGVKVSPNQAGIRLKLLIGDTSADLIRVTFTEQPAEGFTAGMYVFPSGLFDPADMGKRKTIGYGTRDRSLLFVCADGDPFSVFSLELSSDCVIESITAETVSADTVRMAFNPVACAVLAAGLLILLLVESKYRYYASLGGFFRRELGFTKELAGEGKRWRMLLHLSSWIVTLVFLLAAAVLVMLGIYTKLSMMLLFAGAIVATALQLFSRIACERDMMPAKLFAVVMILAGVLLCYVLPPCLYISWDDEFHFNNAYAISHFLEREFSIAQNNITIYQQFPIEEYAKDPSGFITEMERWTAVRVSRPFRLVHPYTAFSYLPTTLTVGLLSLLQSDLVTVMVVSRFANLLAFVLLIYLAVRKLRSGAFIFSAICLMPTVVFIACTYGYDFWLIAWMAYAYGKVISVMQDPDRRFTKSDLIKLLLAFFIGCAPKPIYCFMMLPLLFLPKKKFEKPEKVKKFRIWTVCVFLLILAILALPGLLIPNLYTDTRGGSDVSAGGQIKFILSNPFRYAEILLGFLGQYCSISQMLTDGTFFAHVGNLNLAQPTAFIRTVAVFMLIYCIYTDRKQNDGYELMQPTRWISLATAFFQLVLVVTSLYVGFTPVGAGTVNGCSYRYIYPMLLPFCFFMAPKGIKNTIHPKFQSAFVFGTLALNFYATVQTVYLSTFL